MVSHTPAFILYVMDAYCGWCYGFSSRLREFEAANRHRIAFKVISGGLFIAERARPISAYPHIAEANAHIAELTGAQFGEPYQRLLTPARSPWRNSRSHADSACRAIRHCY